MRIHKIHTLIPWNSIQIRTLFHKIRIGNPYSKKLKPVPPRFLSLPEWLFFLGKSNPYSIKIRKSVLARKKFRGFRGFRKSKKQKSGEITDQVRVVILAGLLSYLLKYALPLAKLLLLLLWFKCLVYRTASSSSWCHSAGSCCDHTQFCNRMFSSAYSLYSF